MKAQTPKKIPMSQAFPLVTRFVTRGTGPKGKGRVDMIIGTAPKKGESFLKPDTVYEIRMIMDEPTLVEVGKSSMDHNMWGHDISTLVECYRERLLLTADEYQRLLDSQKKDEE